MILYVPASSPLRKVKWNHDMQRKPDPERGDWSRWVCDSHWNGLVALHGTSGAGVGVGVGVGEGCFKNGVNGQ